ncbi:polypeptide N-acetylgalactosaminyltransferase 1-like [Limulus polyphemus]|uniref:Polypeptide N-acetylgalactosaminyltransferase n=1 Tax=Limulus polyphemus TaxID=6850 RepID=A0ABM1BQP8_LIMPO|nr:polypeptide N-acetylgalactosaminyltransferase 1-like [Limulus polyphemus]
MLARWINRRRRLTLFKLLLIVSATLGVGFWYSQVRLKTNLESDTLSNKQKKISEIINRSGNGQSSKVIRIEKEKPFQPESLQKPPSGSYVSNTDVIRDHQNHNAQIQRPGSDLIINEDENNNHKNVLPPPSPAELTKESGKNNQRLKLNRSFVDKTKSAVRMSNDHQKEVGLEHKPEDELQNTGLDDGIMKVTPGLGEVGRPVILNQKEQILADELFSSAAFNVYISDRISLNRSVPDARHPLCKNVQYENNLPTASIVIIFTNEMWSSLLRTIHSVMNRTPSHLLHEIILVDDLSTLEYLKGKLENYLKKNLPKNKIKLLRMKKREGLIRARLAGAQIATGDVLVFLDSHCETNFMWLEPLLQRIKEDRKTVVCPIIDVIDDKTLQYVASNGEYFQIGGFTWNGHFTWIEIPEWEEEQRKSVVAPTKSPTMAGGLFAIDRNYFWEIGSYDEGMDVWGGENLEMAFRVWMCGGSLEIIPCSHVGHIFRSFHPYSFPGNKDTHGINTVRTVEVWMDEYKKYFYMHRPDLRHVNYGDITKRLELRDKLQCKDFEWYLENIYPQKFTFDQNVFAFGIVRNPVSNLCLDNLNRDEDKSEPLGLHHCKSQKGVVMNQVFSLSASNELRQEENCAEVLYKTSKYQKVMMVKCHGRGEGQEWHHMRGGPIIHRETGKCLDVAGSKATKDVYVTECKGTHSQIWWFENYLNMHSQVEQQKP